MTKKLEARIAIIGAGPAGLAAALQLTRQGRKPLLFERGEPGGLLRNANWVENYPGFPGGIAGTELVRYFLEHSEQIGVEITAAEVQQLELGNDSYQLQTSLGCFEADIVVVASGTEPQPYRSVPVPASILDRMHYEVAGLLTVEKKDVLILGAGDAALDYALNLSRRNRVIILNRTDQIRGLGLLWDRVQASASIQYLSDHEVLEVAASEDGRVLVDVRAGDRQQQFEVDYIIPAIGRRPAKGFLTKRVKNHLGQLEQDGTLFFIGDVANERSRQTAIAVGDGLRVAMEIESQLTGDS